MHISTPCSISGKHGMGAEAGWGRPDGRCRRTGGICFGTESVPETGIKLQEQAEKPLPWGSFCPKSPPPPPLTKNINNKRPCFPCLLGGGKRAFRTGKMLFQMAQTQQSVEAKQETQGNLTDARTGSRQLPQTGQATPAGSSPGLWLFPGVLGMA